MPGIHGYLNTIYTGYPRMRVDKRKVEWFRCVCGGAFPAEWVAEHVEGCPAVRRVVAVQEGVR